MIDARVRHAAHVYHDPYQYKIRNRSEMFLGDILAAVADKEGQFLQVVKARGG